MPPAPMPPPPPPPPQHGSLNAHDAAERAAAEATARAEALAAARERDFAAREAGFHAQIAALQAQLAAASREARASKESVGGGGGAPHSQRAATPRAEYSRPPPVDAPRPPPLDKAVALRLEKALREQVAHSSTLAAKAAKAAQMEATYMTSTLPHAELPPLEMLDHQRRGASHDPRLERPFESSYLAQYVEQSAQRRKQRERREREGAARSAVTTPALSSHAAEAASAWAGRDDDRRPKTQADGGKLPKVPQRGQTADGLPPMPAGTERERSPWRGSPGAGPSGPHRGAQLVPRPPREARNVKELYPRAYSPQSSRARWANRPESPTSPPLIREVTTITDVARVAALPPAVEPLGLADDRSTLASARSSAYGTGFPATKQLSASTSVNARNHRGSFMVSGSLTAR